MQTQNSAAYLEQPIALVSSEREREKIMLARCNDVFYNSINLVNEILGKVTNLAPEALFNNEVRSQLAHLLSYNFYELKVAEKSKLLQKLHTLLENMRDYTKKLSKIAYSDHEFFNNQITKSQSNIFGLLKLAEDHYQKVSS